MVEACGAVPRYGGIIRECYDNEALWRQIGAQTETMIGMLNIQLQETVKTSWQTRKFWMKWYMCGGELTFTV